MINSAMATMAMIVNDNRSHISNGEIESVLARQMFMTTHRGMVNRKEMAAATIFLLFNFLKTR